MVESVHRQLHVATSDEFSFGHRLAPPFGWTSTEADERTKQQDNGGSLCLRDEEGSNVCGDFTESTSSQCPSKDRLSLVGRSAVGTSDLATGYFRAPIQYGPVRTCDCELCIQVIEGGVGSPLTDDLKGSLSVYVSGEPSGFNWRQHRYQQYLSAEYLELAARRLQQQSLFTEVVL